MCVERIHTAKTDVCRVCVALLMTRGPSLGSSPTAMHRWKSGFTFASGRNKKGKVFGILSQLKKLSKTNDVDAQNVCNQYVTSYYCR